VLRIRVGIDDFREVTSRDAVEYARDAMPRLRAEVQSIVLGHLGYDFEAREMYVERGSILFTIIVATGGAVIYYNDLLSGLERITQQLRWLFGREMQPFSGGITAAMTSSWVPGPALMAMTARDNDGYRPRIGRDGLLVLYLVLSHAVLLAYVLWAVSRRPGF
jgi:hypothetical protein